jgi:hypothetical protein
MALYNASIYMEQGGAKQVVSSGGEVELESGAALREPVTAITTASASTTIEAYGLVTLKSTATAKTVSVNAPSGGERLSLHCLNASSTGYIGVNVGSTGRTFDGTNYIYQFKKAGEHVEIIAASTTRWIEISRSVANGTALTSTST